MKKYEMKFIRSCHDVSKVQSDCSSPTSPTLSLGPICRICHEGESKEDLVTPCHCTGSIAGVHRACLERWLSSTNTDTCEICKFKFVLFRQPMPFTEWILRPSSPEHCRNLTGDLLCFILLTPLASISSYLCFTGARSYASWNVKWEASGLICLSLILIAIYFTWCTITVRYHVQNWRLWRSTHQNVHLIQLLSLSEPGQAYQGNRLPRTASRSSEDQSASMFGTPQLAPAVDVEMTTYPLIHNSSCISPSPSIVSGTSPVNLISARDTTASASVRSTSTSSTYRQCLQPLV